MVNFLKKLFGKEKKQEIEVNDSTIEPKDELQHDPTTRVAIKFGAANECLRAANDAMNEYKKLVDEYQAEFPSAVDYKLAAELLQQLGDNLSQANEKEVELVEAANNMAKDGSLLKEMREFACDEIDRIADNYLEKNGESMSSISFKAKKVVNQEV